MAKRRPAPDVGERYPDPVFKIVKPKKPKPQPNNPRTKKAT